jgi:hypothetical protein
MLSSDTPPELPVWMETYIDLDGDFTLSNPWNAPNHATHSYFAMDMSVTPTSPTVGQAVQIRITPKYSVYTGLYLEAVCGTNYAQVELVPEGKMRDIETLVCEIDTKGWSAGMVYISVFDPDDFLVFNTDEFILGDALPVDGQFWCLY